MNEQYLQGRHIPAVVFQNEGSAQSILLPDWLRARYVDLADQVFEYVIHVVSETDLGMPDAIAFKYYENSNWWWVLCSYNGIVNPATDMFLGQRLRIPLLQQVQIVLQTSESEVSRVGQIAII